MITPKKIAILVSANMLPGHPDQREDIFELEEQMGKIIPAFAANGMEVELVDWREAPDRTPEFDAVLPLFVWDYFEGNEEKFLAAMAVIGQECELFNRFKVINWNADKAYLDELEARGTPTIPTVAVDTLSETRTLRAMDELGTDHIIIKPTVGGGAWQQVMYRRGEPYPDADNLPPRGALIQPFLKSVTEEGEYSFLYFGGGYSHALRKRPKRGDYRVQSIYGGREEPYTPDRNDCMQGRAVLDVLDFTPLYARVDMLRDNNGKLALIELELIEPYLYLAFAEGEGGDNKGAQKLARALLRRLGENA